MFKRHINDGFGNLINEKVFITYMDEFITPTENEDGIEFLKMSFFAKQNPLPEISH